MSYVRLVATRVRRLIGTDLRFLHWTATGAAASLAAIVVACSAYASPPVPTTSAQATMASATAALAPTAAPTLTPSPTAGPTPVEVARISVLAAQPEFREVWAEITNPNESFGWLRAAMELTALGPSGEVLGVQTGALPGAPCCTVYRLGPGGTYGVNMLVEGAVDVEAVEIRIVDNPVSWPDVEDVVPEVTVLSPTLSTTAFVANEVNYSVTGRVEMDSGGPYNVQVIAFIEGDEGFWVAQGGPDCLSAGTRAAFDVTSIGPSLTNPRLGEVIAVTTTVPGLTDPPPGC